MIWNKCRFLDFEKHDKKLESIDKTLDVLVKIEKQAQEGTITNEAALRTKHLIGESLFGLLEQGTTLREIQKAEHIDNLKLLEKFVEPKYLTDDKQTKS